MIRLATVPVVFLLASSIAPSLARADDAIESPGSAGARSVAEGRRGEAIESPGSAGARSVAEGRRGEAIESPGSAGARSVAEGRRGEAIDAQDSAETLRRGRHFGFSVGGAYIPIEGGTSAVFVRADINFGRGGRDLRISPLFYAASSDFQSTVGVGAAIEERWNLGSTYTVSVGGIAAVENADRDDGEGGMTFALGPMISPITLRLGGKNQFELGIDLFLLRDFLFDTLNPGGFVQLTYLSL